MWCIKHKLQQSAHIIVSCWVIGMLASCQSHADYDREWVLHRASLAHRQFQERKGRLLPVLQYYSCGDAAYPCVPDSSQHNKKKHHQPKPDSKPVQQPSRIGKNSILIKNKEHTL